MANIKDKAVSEDIEFSVYEYPKDSVTISVEIDLRDHIDWYSYHDAPSSVTLYLTLNDLMVVKTKVDQAIGDFKKLVDKF